MGVSISRSSGPHYKPGNAASLPKALSSADLKSVLTSLGIDPSKVVSVREQAGGQVTGLRDIQSLNPIGHHTAEALKALGFLNVEALLSLQVADDITRIKNRLATIQTSLIKKADFSVLASLMGFDSDIEGFVLVESDGGLQLLERALDELEEDSFI